MTTLSSIRRIIGLAEGVGTKTYTTAAELPTTGLTAGDQAFVTSTGRLYISNSSGWYNIALINQAPYWIEQPDGSYSLSTTGLSTVITILAGDSDGSTPIYTATADSDFNLIATITTDSEGADGTTFVITPIDSEGGTAVAGSGIVTFVATDGVNQASVASTFSIAFAPDWTGTATESFINSSTPLSGENYAISSSISGDGNYIGVGRRGYTDRGVSNSGAVDILAWNGSSYALQQVVVSNTAVETQYIGASFDINYDGSYLAVACDKHTSNRLYVFTRSGSTWTQQTQIAPPNSTNTGSDFGTKQTKIDKNANYIIVGDESISTYGAVHVFKRTGSSWSLDATISPPANVANQKFGSHISINEDSTYLAIGERGYNSWQGRVHIYTRSGSSWTLQQSVVPADTSSTYQLGYCSINNAGDTLLQCGYTGTQSKAYIWSRSGSTWSLQATLTPADGTGSPTRNFGTSGILNGTGDIVAIGADKDDGNVGAVYIFDRSGSTWTQRKKVVPTINKGTVYNINLPTSGYYDKAIDMTESGDKVIASTHQNDYPNANGNYGASWVWSV